MTTSSIRRQRRKELLDTLKLASDLACESHKRRHIETAFECAVKLLRIEPSQEKVKELVRILEESAHQETYVHYMAPERRLYINGTFDLEKLMEKIVWSSVSREE